LIKAWWICWHIPEIPALGRLRQEDLVFKAGQKVLIRQFLIKGSNVGNGKHAEMILKTINLFK
jgi:hypothetical protein